MEGIKLVVNAGRHDRQDCPVSVTLPKEKGSILTDGAHVLRDEANERFPVQISTDKDAVVLHFTVSLKAGEQKTYVLEQGDFPSSGVSLLQQENRIDVSIDGKLFTSYVYDSNFAKPYLGPIIGTYGHRFTRLDFQVKEHPHQRSVWIAIGDVNGIDFWNEREGYGKQKQTKACCKSGPVYGAIDAINLWTDFDGNPVLEEFRTLTFYNMPSSGRYVDIESRFNASFGKVVFGPTKEAGPLGIRVAETMNVTKGGTMINSYGAKDEEECWGKRAHWCDYYGISDGYLAGIAVYDNPENDHYPTYWHIRNYGLFAPNNFYFTGSRTLEEGESAVYRYRIYFHDGDADSACTARRFHDYICPPKVEII